MNRNNTKPMIVYRVVGRYMTGSSVSAYHLVGTDGSQIVATKERVIYMIGKGLVENLRIQTDEEKGVIIRGKGVNLLTLPIYDEKRNEIRQGANTTTDTKKGNLQQYKIIAQIKANNACIGYILQDVSGRSLKLKVDKVLELTQQGIIANAIAGKKPGKIDSNGIAEPSKFFLRGTSGTELSKLPSVYVDESGKLVDPTNEPVRVRIAKMKRGGIIYDTQKNKKIPFNSGDYIVCINGGALKAVKETDAMKLLTPDTSGKPAICDSYLSNLVNYPIEIFGQTRMTLTQEQILKWSVAALKTSTKQV